MTEAFLEKLQATHSFPGRYTIKIVGDAEVLQRGHIEALVEQSSSVEILTLDYKISAKAAYVSWTVVLQVQTAEQVIQVYSQLHGTEGIRMVL